MRRPVGDGSGQLTVGDSALILPTVQLDMPPGQEQERVPMPAADQDSDGVWHQEHRHIAGIRLYPPGAKHLIRILGTHCIQLFSETYVVVAVGTKKMDVSNGVGGQEQRVRKADVAYI